MSDSSEITALRQDVAALSRDVKDLVDAWNTARGVVRFVKLLGSVATAVAAMWALIKIGHAVK